ncbi:MAG: Na+/H+ antiporter subunit E [Acidobacteriota bacterium]|nr:Na+/H+ antiporter subunit E [Acidobacteriota bacterium]
MKRLPFLVPAVIRFLVLFIFQFVPFYLATVVRANLQVMADVISPVSYARPAVLKLPLSLTKPDAIFMLAGLITMAPGTVCLDVSEDRKYMFVHVMFYNGEGVRRDLKNLERRIGVLFNE